MGEELGDEVAEARGVVQLVPLDDLLAGARIDDGDVRPRRDRVEGHVALRLLALLGVSSIEFEQAFQNGFSV